MPFLDYIHPLSALTHNCNYLHWTHTMSTSSTISQERQRAYCYLLRPIGPIVTYTVLVNLNESQTKQTAHLKDICGEDGGEIW